MYECAFQSTGADAGGGGTIVMQCSPAKPLSAAAAFDRAAVRFAVIFIFFLPRFCSLPIAQAAHTHQ